jgi:DNA-binding transcriptional ArsR family regulator
MYIYMNDEAKLQTIFQTLGDSNRIKIIKFIDLNERSVNEIVSALKLSQPLVSHHLKVMKNNNILETSRQGPFIYYKIKNNKILKAIEFFSEIFNDVDFSK